MGLVYILTNDAFRKDVVKIGRTKDLDQRITKLSGVSGIPLKFKAYAALEVDNYKNVERYIQEILGSKRINKYREFFEMYPEEAYSYFEKLQKILPNSKLYKYDNTGNTVSNNVVDYLDGYNIPIGAVLTHKTGIKAVVESKNRLKYKGELYTLSGLSDLLNNNKSGHPSSYWSYDNKLIKEWKK